MAILGTRGRVPAPVREEDVPQPPALSVEERGDLLDLARLALRIAVGAAPAAALQPERNRVAASGRRASAFVTIRKEGELRGCVGCMDPDQPVGESVTLAATWAALRDGRFEPLVAAELPGLEADVSVLGPLVRLPDPARFQPGVHGVTVERGACRGLLLPEVATLFDLDGSGMLRAACVKAGLPEDAWRLPGTTLHAFRTDRFGGPVLTDPS